MNELPDLVFQTSQRFGQITVEERELPLHDVAVGLRREQARSAVAQHIPDGQFDAFARGLSRGGVFGDLRIEPKERREPRRVASGPADAMAPSLGVRVPKRFQKSRSAEVQFAFKGTRPGIRPRQTTDVVQVLAQGDIDRAGRNNEAGIQGECFIRRQWIRSERALAILRHKVRSRRQKKAKPMVREAFIEIGRSKTSGGENRLPVPALKWIPRQRHGNIGGRFSISKPRIRRAR